MALFALVAHRPTHTRMRRNMFLFDTRHSQIDHVYDVLGFDGNSRSLPLPQTLDGFRH